MRAHMATAGPLAKLQQRVLQCRACAEAEHPIASAPVFSGVASARVMLVGQAPGATEAQTGVPFSGASGRRLFGWLARAGFPEVEFRAGQYITSLTRCYPGKGPSGRGDRVPGEAERALCRAFLESELELVQPRLVIPVGRLAVRVLCGSRPLDELVGSVQQDRAGRWLVPLPHPSGASGWLNAPANRAALERALRHLARLRVRIEAGNA
jgi:uracil-DNA glycosylase